MLSIKQGGIDYYFLSLYDSTWDWTLVSQAIDEHSNYYAHKVMALKVSMVVK